MGKFGSRRLPKFMSEREVTTYGANPRADVEDIKTLKGVNLFPNDVPIVEPKVLQVYGNTPTDKEEAQRFGAGQQKIRNDERWVRILTANDEEKVLLFSEDDYARNRDEDHGGYVYSSLVADDEGWEYRIPIYMCTFTGTNEIEDIYPDEMEYVYSNEPQTYSKSKISSHNMIRKNAPSMNEGHVTESFQDFVNSTAEAEDQMNQQPAEEPQECEGCSDYGKNLSEAAKQGIKKLVNEVLIAEAKVFEDSEDENQTYETYLRECTHYMAECMIRAAQNLKV